MIKYQEKNGDDIIQRVEIDLSEISAPSRRDLKNKITKYLRHEGKNIFNFEAGDKLVYETEALILKVNKKRLNILMVLGNPAVHSVVERMFFSYEGTPTGKRREHRFWRALRDCGVLEFRTNVEKPTPENNNYKRDCLLNGEYESDFNIFLLPYFSFPTPASGECSGVDGIRKIVGKDIFTEMLEFEFRRFEGIVLTNDIKNVICFQKRAKEEILKRSKPEHIALHTAGPTRLLHTNKGKKILKDILSDITNKKVG